MPFERCDLIVEARSAHPVAQDDLGSTLFASVHREHVPQEEVQERSLLGLPTATALLEGGAGCEGHQVHWLETDGPATALVRDLKQRGLLDTTLVVWGGEFGRTPMNEGRGGSKLMGRDHHPRAFTIWMAGGGIKPGITIGRTDDLGYNVVEDPVEVHDLHATILHVMGLDHTKLTYKFQGREFRLTDVSGEVVTKLLA